MKRFFSFCLAIFACITIWALDFQYGDLYYNITNKTVPYTAEVTCSSGNPSYNYKGVTTITIPTTATYNGKIYSVTRIGSDAFLGCRSLTSVNIPETVASIESDALSYCTGLTSIAIPDSVTSIGSNAFFDCTGLVSITLLIVGENTFNGCPISGSHFLYQQHVLYPYTNSCIRAMYFPIMSNSRLTTVPTSINLKLVCSWVYGIIHTLT